MRMCSNCKKAKPLSEFSTRNRKSKDGTIKVVPLCYCKSCNSEIAKERYYKLKMKGIRFVYRILNKDGEVIYVGKTESLPNRTNQHFSKSNSHLYERARAEIDKIQYIAMGSTAMMDIKEIYYINLYKPKYNSSYMYDEDFFTISDFSNDIWLDYNVDEINNLNKLNFKLNVRTIFKRKRNDKYYVYIEYIDIYGKKHQKRDSTFKDECEADRCIKDLKKFYNLKK